MAAWKSGWQGNYMQSRGYFRPLFSKSWLHASHGFMQVRLLHASHGCMQVKLAGRGLWSEDRLSALEPTGLPMGARLPGPAGRLPAWDKVLRACSGPTPQGRRPVASMGTWQGYGACRARATVVITSPIGYRSLLLWATVVVTSPIGCRSLLLWATVVITSPIGY